MKEFFSKTFEGATSLGYNSTITVCEVRTFEKEPVLQLSVTHSDKNGFKNETILLTKETAKNIGKVFNEYFLEYNYDYMENVQTEEIKTRRLKNDRRTN